MRVHTVWSGYPEGRPRRWIRMLKGVEWVFLLFGLAAVDLYIWINTSSVVYESYEDWAFDQDLRGLAPSALRFAGDELRAVLGRERFKPETLVLPGPTAKREALPESKPQGKARVPSAVIGRLEIPNLHLVAMVEDGADAGTLGRAVGHIPGTGLPGARGNVGLAGHRDTFFRPLRDIQVNDDIELQTENE